MNIPVEDITNVRYDCVCVCIVDMIVCVYVHIHMNIHVKESADVRNGHVCACARR